MTAIFTYVLVTNIIIHYCLAANQVIVQWKNISLHEGYWSLAQAPDSARNYAQAPDFRQIVNVNREKKKTISGKLICRLRLGFDSFYWCKYCEVFIKKIKRFILK